MDDKLKKPPRHVAIIMDGNGRWAKSRGKPRIFGHRRGAEVVDAIVTATRETEIPFLTLYTFSTQNWERPPDEVEALMGLLRDFLIDKREKILNNEIRLTTIGETEKIPSSVRTVMNDLIDESAANDKMVLCLALSYGGQEEILRAAKLIAEAARLNRLNPGDLDAGQFEKYLYTAEMPPPDLLIRTSGEVRISNFLLWQLAYTEMVFTETLWPDFTRAEYERHLNAFGSRERRLGRTGDQLTTGKGEQQKGAMPSTDRGDKLTDEK